MGVKLTGSLKKQAPKVNEMRSFYDPKSVVSDFVNYSRIRNLSDHTLRGYRIMLRKFFEKYTAPIDDVDALKRHMQALLSEGSNEYYNKRLSAFRQFFGYCIEQGIIKSNPAHGFKFRKHSIRIVEQSEETMQRFIRLIDKDRFSGLRDYGFVTMMLDTGIRPSEALKIRIDDVDFSRRLIKVRAEVAKTREERILPTSLTVIHILEKLVRIRPQEWNKDTPILCTYEGNEMATTVMRRRFENYSRKLGTTITTYQLRHTFAVNFIRNGGDAFTLQRIMGHTTMDMTKVYVQLSSKDIQDKHAEASPLQNFIGGGKRVKNLKK